MSSRGFDFIKLTRGQWRHLLRVQRDHGIAWHEYIKMLIQQDIEGKTRLRYPMEGKDPITPETVNKLILKIEELLSLPLQHIPTWIPPPPSSSQFGSVLEGGIDESRSFLPSDLQKTSVDPNVLSDGTDIKSSEFREAFMDELNQALGILPKKSKPRIQFPDHVEILDAPDPPKVSPDS